MPFGLRRRLRDGGGSHQYHPPTTSPPPPQPTYEPTLAQALAVPHLFAPAHAAEAATHAAQALPPGYQGHAAPPLSVGPAEPAPQPVPQPVAVPQPVPVPRRAMRPAEALAELSALARSAVKPQMGSGNGGGGQ